MNTNTQTPDIEDDILTRVLKAKTAVREQNRNRVSRRLLLTERASHLTCVCEKTGIVSLLQVPAIPGYALSYTHPLSINVNARGLAQKGREYLQKLDTQTLAGILITLADHYSLFQYKESESGAQKNALLRTAGKENLLNGIITIERFVHSSNQKFLPRLSLVFDTLFDYTNVESRLLNYLKTLVDAIIKPDTSELDLSVKKIGKPVYIKDVEKEQRRVSLLARSELAMAKKEYAQDKKTAKILLNTLCTEEKISVKMKAFLLSLFSDDAIIVMDESSRSAIAGHEKVKNNEHLAPIAAIILKDRSKLTMDIAEMEELIETRKQEEIKEEIFSDVKYGSDTEDDTDSGTENSIEEAPSIPVSSEEIAAFSQEYNAQMEAAGFPQNAEIPAMPENLSPMEKILWRKKHLPKAKGMHMLPQIDSVHKYIPTDTKIKMGKDIERGKE
jgi:hypothetical protein